MIAVAVLSSLGLVLLSLLRGGILSSGRSAQEAFLLSNARKAFSGSGPKKGLLDDAQQAEGVSAVSTGTLALLDFDGAEVDYSSFTDLSVTYYARTPDYRIAESSDPASIDLIAVSLGIQGKSHGFRVYSGARLMNAP